MQDPPANRPNSPRADAHPPASLWRLTLVMLAGTFVYAVVRYVVIKGVPPAQIPVFIVNKAVSWTGLWLLCAACLCSARPCLDSLARWAGRWGFGFVALHVLMAVIIISPGYYGKLFGPDARLTWMAEGSMLCGVVGLALLARHAWQAGLASVSGAPPPASHAAIILLLSVLHLAGLGAPGWLTIHKWPGFLPPITLLAALGAFCTLVWRLARRRRPWR